MLRIGITGGIGSGKTTVCRIFETLGIPVYYADIRAKWLMVHQKSIVSQIQDLLGEAAYQENGSLNRAYIANIVFREPEKLKALNAIVHPAVHEDGEVWHQQQKDVPYTLKEAALLFESGSYQSLDKIITVTAPLELRIKWVMQRDHSTREAVEARINQQWPEAEKIKLSDFVIKNDLQHSLIQQVYHIHQQLSLFSTKA